MCGAWSPVLPTQTQREDGHNNSEDKRKMESAGSRPRTGTGHLLPEERRRRIVEMLHHTESITVPDLVQRFGVSRVTARADLDYLAGQGALVRSHGGALKNMDPRSDYPLQVKQTLHHAEKVRIAGAAVKLIKDGDTIAFDSGTTTCEIAKQITRLNLSSLTVITNALNIANELSSLLWVSLIMTGGILRHKSGSFNGPHALETLRDLNVNHLFLGADAFDVEAGLTTPDILGAQVALRMIELAQEVTVVVDASKFGRHSLTLSGKTEDIDRVITDARVSATHVDPFASAASKSLLSRAVAPSFGLQIAGVVSRRKARNPPSIGYVLYRLSSFFSILFVDISYLSLLE